MKIVFSFLSFSLLMFTLGMARTQQQPGESCGFTVQSEPAHPTITGPDDILPLVYVVEQPDSPIEIVSLDLSGMWLSVANEQYTARDCATYKVRNRSDRPVQDFNVELSISGGGGFGAHPSSPLPPGQTVEIKSCGSGGHGGVPGNRVRLLVFAQSVVFGDCFYRPSARIPRSLGVHPVW